MEHSIRISIPRTYTENQGSLLFRSHTVYEVRIIINCTCTLTAFKRYSQFCTFKEEISGVLKRSQISLPKFPAKCVFQNSKVVSERRILFEAWLKAISKSYQLTPYLYRFLNIQADLISQIGTCSSQLPTPDEEIIFDFSIRLNTDSRNKTKALEDFEWDFFSKRRTIRPELISFLLKTLIPLCALRNLGSKVMDVITKLTSRDRHRDYQEVIKELIKIEPELLSEMRLNEHLTKKVHGESQTQAFHICQILAEHLRSNQSENKIINILNDDQEAFDIFSNWENEQIVFKKPDNCASQCTAGMWRPLINEDMKACYRLVNRKLEINAEFSIETCISRLIEIITVPHERKKWDLRLIEMEEMCWNDGTGGFRMLYMFDRTPIEFHTVLNITQSENFAMVEFQSRPNLMKPQNDLIIGSFSSYYRFELVNAPKSAPTSPQSSISTDESDTNHSSLSDYLEEQVFKQEIKCSWNSHFCEHSTKMLLADLCSESILLKNSMLSMMRIVENKEELRCGFNGDYRLVDAYDRKKLRKLSDKRRNSKR